MKLTGTYIDGFLLPVPTAMLEEYRKLATKAATIWKEHGALHYVEAAADDLATDFCRSFTATAEATEGETVIFAFAVFADKAARDAAYAKIMADERMSGMCTDTAAIFESKRMSYGGFRAIVNE